MELPTIVAAPLLLLSGSRGILPLCPLQVLLSQKDVWSDGVVPDDPTVLELLYRALTLAQHVGAALGVAVPGRVPIRLLLRLGPVLDEVSAGRLLVVIVRRLGHQDQVVILGVLSLAD